MLKHDDPGLMRLMRRYDDERLAALGWRLGSSLENDVIRALRFFGFKPADVSQEHRVGLYHFDFAWPSVRVGLEADGIYHDIAANALKDAKRDAWLRSEGWLVLRVNDEYGLDSLARQVGRVCQLVRALSPLENLPRPAQKGRGRPQKG